MDGLLSQVAAVLSRYVKAGDRIIAGLSGGRDSVVLLAVLHQLQGQFGYRLAAHHVNHQISPNAESWVRFCANLCKRLSVPFDYTTVAVPRDTGKGIEATARNLRYGAFQNLKADFIVLAHHQDDQAETLLLRLFRGAGVKGLAAMAESSTFAHRVDGDLRVLRPLLHIPRSILCAFAEAENFQWIDDESNTDIYYTRNYLRAGVLPQIEARFPSYRSALDRAASQFAEAESLLGALAAIDAQGVIHGQRIALEAFNRLEMPRAKNLLRYFLAQHHLKMPDHRRLEEMLRQISCLRDDAEVCLVHDGIELRRFRGWLYVVHPISLADNFSQRWIQEMPWQIAALQGTLFFENAFGKGIRSEVLLRNTVTVRVRRGGEKLRLAENRPRQTLKKLFLDFGIPPWERDRLPLLFIGDELAYVPGIGINTIFQAKGNTEGFLLNWMLHPVQ